MKVAFITRSTLYSAPGGDTIQILQTAKHMNALGICVDIKLTNEISSYDEYNLLHFFNITRPADILYHISKSQKPFVVSTIFIDYSNYDKNHRKGLSGFLFRLLSSDHIEYFKTASRYILGKDKLKSLSYFFKGQRRSITEILKKAKLLLPNSETEYASISKAYQSAAKYATITNGVSTELFQPNDDIEKDPLMVLCVARIEGLKNQINLIKALNNTKYHLFIIGKPAPNQYSYYKKCRQLASENISFIDYLSQEELLQYYQRAKVHVLPSWFETTGLSSLEAAAMGCNIVITDKGYTKEYFDNNAIYCDPASPESIFNAIETASMQSCNKNLQKKILTDYTWRQASLQTIKAYSQALEK